jgi:hypothetical protein
VPKHKHDAIFPCNTRKCELDPWKHKNVMNYTQDQYKIRIMHTWCRSYRFGTKFFKKLLQNMKNTYVHCHKNEKVSNYCHKTDHISGPIVEPTCLDLEEIIQLYRTTVRDEDYMNPTTDGILSWQSITSCVLDSYTGLEN